MGATLTTVSAITKQVYGPRIVDQLENEITLTKRIEKTSRNTTSTANGKFVKFPLKTRRNQGIGYRNELEQLQTPGQQGWAEVEVPLRYGYGRVHLSGQAIELVNENSAAFASAMTEEMTGLKDDIAKDTNRILWGDGLGLLATVSAATVTLNTFDAGANGFDDVKYLDLDMQIDILSSDGATTRAANRKITAIDEATSVVTFDGAAVSLTAGDIVVRQGNYGREPKGLAALVKAGGTLFGLSSATEPLWNSYVDTSGGALSEAKMIATCDVLRQKGGRPSVLFADLGTRRAYFNLLKTDRRITNTQTFEGGFKGLAFAYDDDIPLVTDVDAPAKTIHFLREEDFTVYHRKEWDWEDKDGSIWKWVPNFDAFEAMMKKYWEFALERRNTQAKMTNITAG